MKAEKITADECGLDRQRNEEAKASTNAGMKMSTPRTANFARVGMKNWRDKQLRLSGYSGKQKQLSVIWITTGSGNQRSR
jgi:hypothetical protein